MDRTTLSALNEALAHHQSVVLATCMADGEQALLRPLDPPSEADAAWPWDEVRTALLNDRAHVADSPRGAVFLRPYNPPVRVMIIGAVHVSQALVPMVAASGFAPVIIDPRTAFASEARFPGVQLVHSWPVQALAELEPDHRTAIVALSHDPKFDDDALAIGLESPAFYVGALGSRRTHAKRVQRLEQRGIGADALARIHAPIGLPIGARTPEEIAVSIVAQIISVLRKDH